MIYKSYLIEKNISTINENLVLIYEKMLVSKTRLKKKLKKHLKSEILLFNQDEILKTQFDIY